MVLHFYFLLLCPLFWSALGVALDNEVVGTPQIQCTEDMINFTVETRNAFRLCFQGHTKLFLEAIFMSEGNSVIQIAVNNTITTIAWVQLLA